MSCPAFRRLLPLYVDGVARASEHAAVAAHLAHCPECAREVREWRWLAAALETWPTPEPPPHFVAQVRRRLLRRHPPQARATPRRWAWAAVGVVLLGVGLGTQWLPFPPEWGLAAWVGRGQAAVETATALRTEVAAAIPGVFRAVPTWFRQVGQAGPWLGRDVNELLDDLGNHPLLAPLQHWLALALALALAGNLVNHLAQRRALVRPVAR